jgi:hypothetical protein
LFNSHFPVNQREQNLKDPDERNNERQVSVRDDSDGNGELAVCSEFARLMPG